LCFGVLVGLLELRLPFWRWVGDLSPSGFLLPPGVPDSLLRVVLILRSLHCAFVPGDWSPSIGAFEPKLCAFFCRASCLVPFPPIPSFSKKILSISFFLLSLLRILEINSSLFPDSLLWFFPNQVGFFWEAKTCLPPHPKSGPPSLYLPNSR